jgi:hypothetical protein
LRNPKIVGELKYTRSALISGIKQMHITFDPEHDPEHSAAAA